MLHWIDGGISYRAKQTAKYSYIRPNEAIRSLAAYDNIDFIPGSPYGQFVVIVEQKRLF